MGDYTGNTWSGVTFIAAWMDSSNGVDMQEEVGGVRQVSAAVIRCDPAIAVLTTVYPHSAFLPN